MLFIVNDLERKVNINGFVSFLNVQEVDYFFKDLEWQMWMDRINDLVKGLISSSSGNVINDGIII